ncbi:transmembrane protein 71 isoform X1 [Ambystoma mexicanum]|uniref:transmembrane protein 71 isoform X1 n=1 Tax=Ambystoma mexicanum TaxID=8296 RepID=UPI0037E73602
MYSLFDLQSTPVASKYPSIRGAPIEDLSTNIFDYSLASDPGVSGWLHSCSFCDDSAINTLSRLHLTCRRSPRLLTNGYYVLNEDSALSSVDGNLTLTPTKTSVTYKERLVRIFRRKKKKICKSLASIFGMKETDTMVDSSINNMEPTNKCGIENEEDSEPENDISLDNVNQKTPVDNRMFDPQNVVSEHCERPFLPETPTPLPAVTLPAEDCNRPTIHVPPVLSTNTGKTASCSKRMEITDQRTPFQGDQRSVQRTGVPSKHVSGEECPVINGLQRTQTEGKQRHDQRPDILNKRVSSGGFLIIKGDQCEFSHDPSRWTLRNRRPYMNAVHSQRGSKVLSPWKACYPLTPMTQPTPPRYFRERNFKDFEINISRSPIYLIVVILVCLLISAWRT